MKKYKNIALVLAGGSGTRMKMSVPKQFLKIGDESILQRTISVFRNSPLVDMVVLALPKKIIPQYVDEINGYGFGDFLEIIEGGSFRQESAYKGLRYLKENGGCDVVSIHDAVRPFITPDMVTRSIELANEHGACEVAVPAVDTLIQTDGLSIQKVLDRSKIYHTQTPQTFLFEIIFEAHEKAWGDKYFQATDDAGLVLRLGKKVIVQEGSYHNIKITSPADLEYAKNILNQFNQ